jgi:hypothetical protein
MSHSSNVGLLVYAALPVCAASPAENCRWKLLASKQMHHCNMQTVVKKTCPAAAALLLQVDVWKLEYPAAVRDSREDR